MGSHLIKSFEACLPHDDRGREEVSGVQRMLHSLIVRLLEVLSLRDKKSFWIFFKLSHFFAMKMHAL